MRDYAKISGRFWTGGEGTGKAIREAGAEATVVALYLMSSPHSNMLGLYPLPMLYLAHETGLGMEGASKGLRSCVEAGFCRYDQKSEMVWVREMAFYQIADELKPGDNRSKGIQKELEALPRNPFTEDWVAQYAGPFRLYTEAPYQAPPKPLRSQEQEQEHEQEQEQEQKEILSPKPKVGFALKPEEEKPIGKGELRARVIAGEAVRTFNAAKLTKKQGGKIANVSDSVGFHNRVKQVKRVLRLASEIQKEATGSQVITEKFWSDYWDVLADDNFMAGRTKPGNGHENWKPDFEYFTREATMLKVFERASGGDE